MTGSSGGPRLAAFNRRSCTMLQLQPASSISNYTQWSLLGDLVSGLALPRISNLTALRKNARGSLGAEGLGRGPDGEQNTLKAHSDAESGSIICRQRHKKCDEASPRCTNCSIANRACIWPRQATQLETTPDALSPGQGADSGITQGSPNYLQESLDLLPEEPRGHPNPPDSDSIIQTCAYSPSNTVTSDCLPADLASVRWLDLLATDAIQANRGFSRAPSPVQGPAGNTDLGGSSNYPSRSGPILSINDQNIGNERFSWRLDQDIVLKDFEIAIFRNFINRAALWLGVFDPDMHFSTYATRLALRNVGLMKAIIALSAQHLSRQTQSQDGSNTIADPNLAVQYYYETLHYVQTALQYNSYAHSEVILATALVISTYEMLDESDSGWQRHLKGVFWIQRSQNVNGASGGIRQAVWWAWLRQDVWAAFREKRRCLSFWKPVKVYSELNQHELLDRATYLLSQVVNYCADRNESSGLGREGAADELFEMLDHWKSFLDESFKPLPTVGTNGTFQPIWIHPPKFGTYYI